MNLSTEEFLKIDFGNTVYKKSTSGFNGGKFNTKTRNVGEKRKLPPISDDCSMKKTSSSMSVLNGDKNNDGIMILPYVPVVSAGHSGSSLTSKQYQSSSWAITPVHQSPQSLVTRQNIIYKPDHNSFKVHLTTENRNGSSYEREETFEKEMDGQNSYREIKFQLPFSGGSASMFSYFLNEYSS
ncbi:hypothetical protein LOTGIDRAFT_152061 [Lottia gigantea]|uniref:Uncharacterized protein n=1 Tax=Lottia gigantea TaxID=225164 RepID=V4CRU2_LOTGI|nr:hypothetical protein LOTGIDRAFT_152061 [Lottia gigantea]ESP05245.1 hypothetical protein LOTGIDRAFT_152061 [Lottia gigantea]